MGDGIGMGISVSFDPAGQPVIDMTKTDPTAPARNISDILPPETSKRFIC